MERFQNTDNSRGRLGQSQTNLEMHDMLAFEDDEVVLSGECENFLTTF